MISIKVSIGNKMVDWNSTWMGVSYWNTGFDILMSKGIYSWWKPNNIGKYDIQDVGKRRNPLPT